MLAVSSFAVPTADGDAFLGRALDALGVLAARPGYVRGRVCRAVDDPTRWLLVSEWIGVGAYRRALSAYDVRVGAGPLLAEARDEPGAYEVLYADGPEGAAVSPSDRAG